ncbi:MAG: glycosyltransferase family 2 protein [Deltaproteobacteria bacterium]|nr:glycosyltransferase family 2 protein [Deltaproteobacteria bacterium]
MPAPLVNPLLSIVIPVYNEREWVAELVRRVLEQPFTMELILIDDGSTDGTRDILPTLADAHDNVRVLMHEQNRGKGAALRTGFAEAKGDVIVIQDADLEYDPRDYGKLLEPILDGRADVVYGSRFLGGPHRVLNYHHYIANRSLTALSNALTNLNLTDMETCYKVFRREVLDGMKLSSDRFGFEPEFTARVSQARLKIYEVPISYSGRDYEEGKKITWRDGVAALWVIMKSRFDR